LGARNPPVLILSINFFN